MKHPFFLFVVFLVCFESVLFADVFDKPEFVHAVRKYYRIVGQAKKTYETELRKERDYAQKQGDVPYFNEIDIELNHTISEGGHNVTEYMPKTKALFNAKLQLKQTIDKVQAGFKRYADTLASELLKNGRVDEARNMNNLVDAGEPPIHLGKPGVNVPQPETAKGKQLLKNLLAENERPQAVVKQVEIPVIKKKEDNPFAAKLGSEIEQAVRKKFLNIPESKLKNELSSRPGSWCQHGRFTPDGKKIVVVSHSEGGGNVFDIATGKLLVKLAYPQRLYGIDVHPDSRIAATGTDSGTILLWNIDNGKIIHEIKEGKECIEGMKFSPDGSFFISGSANKTAVIWDTKTAKEIFRFQGHTDRIWNLDISPDGKLLATSSLDGSVRLWDIKTGRELHCMKGHANHEIRALAFNHQGTILASGSFDHTVVFWDVKTGKQIKRLVGCETGIAALDFSPDDSKVVVGCAAGIRSAVWDVDKGVPLYWVASLDGWDQTAKFSPDGKTILTCSHDPIRIWNVPTDEELTRWERDLKQKRETTKEILLKDMLLEYAQAGWSMWHWNTYSTPQRKYENSLWAHAPSKYVFRLDGKWKTLKMLYGIMENPHLNESNCIFIVKGNGKELFRSNEIRDAVVRPVNLNVEGIDKLELIVDPNGSNAWDQGVWYTPTLSR